MCTNDCSLTSLKQQKSVKRINISCKVTFGFKYIQVQCVNTDDKTTSISIIHVLKKGDKMNDSVSFE